MAAGAALPAVTAAIVPGKVMDQLTKKAKRKKPKSSHQTIEKAPQINNVSVVWIELDPCNPIEISKTVVHMTLVIAPIPPAKLIYYKGTIVEDTEVARFA